MLVRGWWGREQLNRGCKYRTRACHRIRGTFIGRSTLDIPTSPSKVMCLQLRFQHIYHHPTRTPAVDTTKSPAHISAAAWKAAAVWLVSLSVSVASVAIQRAPKSRLQEGIRQLQRSTCTSYIAFSRLEILVGGPIGCSHRLDIVPLLHLLQSGAFLACQTAPKSSRVIVSLICCYSTGDAPPK